MNYDGKHRAHQSMDGAVPRRAFLVGGILAAGAAFGVQGMTGQPPQRTVRPPGARAEEEGSGDRRPRTSRDARRASATVPLIYRTEQWGAEAPDRDASVRRRPPKYIIVHHTATDNVDDYSLSRAQRLARAIQNVHKEQGWGDTGQHLTISRGGHILEGRTGSIAAVERGEMVVGTHVRGVNDVAVGIECEGTYNTVLPPRRLRESLVEVCVWLCEQYDLNPHEAIMPHRKFNDTDCCGDKFAPTLPDLRDDVAGMLPSKLR